MTLVAVADPPPGRSLDELAAIANSEHALTVDGVRQAVEHAIRAGEALLAIQDIIGWGGWNAWLQESWTADESTARCYMRIAAYRDEVEGTGITSVRRALYAVRGLPPVGLTLSQSRVADANREEARRLRDEGMSLRKIAEELGVGKQSVRRYLNPEMAQQERRARHLRSTREKRGRRLLEAQERELEIKKAVRKAGAAVSEAWAMSERMQDVLAQAEREVEDRSAKAALAIAGEHYRKMRDEIVRALGVSA